MAILKLLLSQVLKVTHWIYETLYALFNTQSIIINIIFLFKNISLRVMMY